MRVGALPGGSWETGLEARAQELAATTVRLEEITDPILRMQVRLIRSGKTVWQGRRGD